MDSLLSLATKVVNIVGWPTLCYLAWRISARFTRIETTVETIQTNHLKHIDDDLQLIKEALLKKD